MEGRKIFGERWFFALIAAIFVETGGVYYDLPDVTPYDINHDARDYPGPWPVVAHPPCKRWGRYWSGGPSAKVRRMKGDDAGCFAAALTHVRNYGGVLEHPEASYAWVWFGLKKPPRSGGWVSCDDFGGYTCCVEQGHYGHRARKATWLYSVGCDLPELIWGPSTGIRLDDGFHSSEARRIAKAAGHVAGPRISAAERVGTPIPFRDLLLDIARTVG